MNMQEMVPRSRDLNVGQGLEERPTPGRGTEDATGLGGELPHTANPGEISEVGSSCILLEPWISFSCLQ